MSAEMEKFYGNKYRMERCENLDELLIEMGINSVMRKIAKTITTTVQLVKKDDGSFSLNSTMMLITIPQKFRLGEEVDVKTQDGRQVKNSFTIEGNVLTELQVGEKTFVIVREFSEDEMIVTSTIGNITSKAWCKKVK